MLRRESPCLEFKGNKALQIPMIEEQIEFEVLIANLDANLFSDKGEAVAQLHQEFSQVQ
jgi:hypothetical protein